MISDCSESSSTAGSTWTRTPDSSPHRSPGPLDFDDTDSEDFGYTKPHTRIMDNNDGNSGHNRQQSSRPVSLVGAHARPTLDDVLADRAPPPFTLPAFMAFLSQNHCLETLEFTIDAGRYSVRYADLSRDLGEFPIRSEGPRVHQLCGHFNRLLTHYVAPGAPREINLPSAVRDALLSYSLTQRPPPPSALDAAIRRMRDLMDESIFLPFLNSHSIAPQPTPLQSHYEPSENTSHSHSPTEPSSYHGYGHHHNLMGRHASVTSSGARPSITGSGRHPAFTSIPVPRSSRHRSGPSSTSGDSTTPSDDTGSIPSSPGDGGSGLDPPTPPTTPPSSDPSPRAHGISRQDAWKKMSMRFGFKK